jgi:hypothetical protein
VSKHWFPTGRLGLHAYAAQGVAWEHTWIEEAAGDLSTLFEPVTKTLEGAVPKIRKLLEERAREEERRQKEWEEQKKRWRREEEERRRKEEGRVNGGADQELTWALKYADRINPLTSWRRDIENVKAEAADKPCADSRKVHGGDEGDADANAGTHENENAPDAVVDGARENSR